ncbi:MAG: hypothetical protein IJH88_01440 [Eggerthellaceae bacterium]|nr:hypothetical protein [Eggerthellaceae bacterium]
MRKKAILLASLAVALVLGMSITPAWGYFTDTHTANGGLQVRVTPSPTIYEWYAEGTKHLVVSNEQNATSPVFARARVITTLDTAVAGEGWYGPVTDGDAQWYYYGTSENDLTEIAPGASSNELTVKITFPRLESATQPDGSAYGDQLNVIVYYEATAVEYRADGTTFADWNKVPKPQES